MIVLLATSALADPVPADDPRLSEYYGRRLRHNAELVDARLDGPAGGSRWPRGTSRSRSATRTGSGGSTAAAGRGARSRVATAAVGASPPGRDRPVRAGIGTRSGAEISSSSARRRWSRCRWSAVHLSSRPNRAPVSAYYDEPAADTLIEGYNRDLAAELALDPSVLDAP